MKQRIEYILFLGIRAIVLALPLKSAQRLGAALGSVGYFVIAGRRRIALENLRKAFPEKSEEERKRIARGAFRSFAISFVELLWFPNFTDELLSKTVRYRNPELVTDAYAARRGLILLTGHFANWELNAFATGRILNIPLTIIVQTQSNKLVDAVINRHRSLLGNRVVPMGLAVREIVRTLQEKGVVAIAPDQSGPREGVYVRFFDRLVATHQGPAVFALRSRAPIIMGWMMRQSDGTYEVVFQKVEYSDLTEYNESNVRELTQRHTAILEEYTRRYPDHWLWLHRRWKNLGGDDNQVVTPSIAEEESHVDA